MAERGNPRPTSSSSQRGNGRPPPANVKLFGPNGQQRMNLNIHSITGGVMVGSNLTVTTIRDEGGRGSSSRAFSSSSSDDSDLEELAVENGFPLGVFRDMKRMHKMKGGMRQTQSTHNTTFCHSGANRGGPDLQVLTIGQNNAPGIRAIDRSGLQVPLRTLTGQPVPASIPQASAPRATPTSRPQASTPQATPTRRPQASTPQATPTSRPQASTPQATPTSNYQASTSQARPTTNRWASTPHTTPTTQTECRDTSSITTYDLKTQVVDTWLKKIGKCKDLLVDESILRKMTQEFGHGWRRVFRWLGFKDAEIDATYLQSRQVQETVHQLLVSWTKRKGCTIRVLLEALVRADQMQIVQSMIWEVQNIRVEV